MTRPLYKAAQQHPTVFDPGGNAGLWFDKFCDKWQVEPGSWTMSASGGGENPKLAWIRTVTLRPMGTRDHVAEAALRMARLVEGCAGKLAVFTTESRFVTGLGRSHPVENGFAWHPTLGTPYLPGSSIKGLIRSWAREQADPPPSSETIARLLGAPGSAGGLCFLDAVPVAPVQLEADVMTPHYAGWDEGDPPGDWRSPNPIPFLVTASKTSFLFGIVPRSPDVSNEEQDVALGLLRSALTWSGAGAKTAVGYGRFRHDHDQTHQWARRPAEEKRKRIEDQERLEAMGSPEGRWRLKIQGCSEREVLDLVRIHLEKEPLEDPVEREAFIKAVFSTGLVENWRRGRVTDTQTRVGKKKLKERARLLNADVGRSAGTRQHPIGQHPTTHR